MPSPYLEFDPTINSEIIKPTIHLKELSLDTELELTLGEGSDCLRQLRLHLRLARRPDERSPAVFAILGGDISGDVVENNSRRGMKNPRLIGGAFITDYACTYREGYMPPFTLAGNDMITIGRSLVGRLSDDVDHPTEIWRYHAEVLACDIL